VVDRGEASGENFGGFKKIIAHKMEKLGNMERRKY
jgi:hypothetical protein